MTKELRGFLKPSWFGVGDFSIKLEYNGGRAKWLEVSPRLCERCGGTGKVAKPRAGTGDS